MSAYESPKKPHWPPRSPAEALLSSPAGRKKVREQYERNARTSVSPSPTKWPASAKKPTLASELSDEDDDEETLRLKLEAIEARLKLKKLQQAKAKKNPLEDEDDQDAEHHASQSSAPISRRGEPRTEVLVPVSPIKKHRESEPQSSPKRVLLGIDKGIRAQDVSLKRAASYSFARSTASTRSNPFAGQLGNRPSTSAGREISRPKSSFSDRLLASRTQDRERQERQERQEKNRSHGFNVDRKELEKFREKPSSSPRSQNGPSQSRTATRGAKTDSPALSSRSESSFGSKTSSSTKSTATTEMTNATTDSADTNAASFESYSGFHLTKRLTPHNVLTRNLEGKAIFSLPRLFKTVVSPNYDPPETEEPDFVVMGIIASKSTPINHKKNIMRSSTGDPDEEAEADQVAGRAKFMVLRLTDLKWELDCFLFSTGFTQFWKLPVGTVVAILNPGIMPPRDRDTGQFSLKVSSSEDTILEIGNARDLGFCGAQRKDGKDCGSWVDRRKTEICEFHVSMQIEKSKRGRMEVNTMSGFGKGPQGRGGMFGGGGSSGRGRGGGGPSGKYGNPSRVGEYRDWGLHETMHIIPGTSAAKLLDNENRFENDLERGGSREGQSRKRLAEKEKERELMKKLGQIGSGVGSEYLKASSGDKSATKDPKPTILKNTESTAFDDLTLMARTAEDVRLSPVRRKRFGNAKSTSNDPVGWGGANKRGLLMREEMGGVSNSSKDRKDEKRSASGSIREPSPVKKRARLYLEGKGIREPGRESLGAPMKAEKDIWLDDDDDDLEII